MYYSEFNGMQTQARRDLDTACADAVEVLKKHKHLFIIPIFEGNGEHIGEIHRSCAGDITTFMYCSKGVFHPFSDGKVH